MRTAYCPAALLSAVQEHQEASEMEVMLIALRLAKGNPSSLILCYQTRVHCLQCCINQHSPAKPQTCTSMLCRCQPSNAILIGVVYFRVKTLYKQLLQAAHPLWLIIAAGRSGSELAKIQLSVHALLDASPFLMFCMHAFLNIKARSRVARLSRGAR